MNYKFLLDLALILFTTKLFGIIVRKFGMPQVLGALIAGILLGVTKLVSITTELTAFAAVGVNLIMFSAGMETNFKEIKKNGTASIMITIMGVVVPLFVGFGVSWMIPGISIKERWFLGVILTATSVGITVAVLKELDVLHGKVGASIVTAAIIDDIIGIIILAFFTANTSPKTLGARILTAFNVDFTTLASLTVLMNVVLFFVIGISFGILIHYGFKYLCKRFPHTRRLSIFGLISCFLYAWGAEELFGVAAITGAFLAGMMMANMPQTEYVERRIDMSAYMMFSPIFFASIGIGLPYNTLVNNFSWTVLGFSVVFIIVGMLSKFLGCGLGAGICKYKVNQCVKVGAGMMVRGEVCLILAEAGKAVGLVDDIFYPAIIGLIIITSIVPPIILKTMYKKYPSENLLPQQADMLNTVESVQHCLTSGTGECSIDTKECIIDTIEHLENKDTNIIE